MGTPLSTKLLLTHASSSTPHWDRKLISALNTFQSALRINFGTSGQCPTAGTRTTSIITKSGTPSVCTFHLITSQNVPSWTDNQAFPSSYVPFTCSCSLTPPCPCSNFDCMQLFDIPPHVTSLYNNMTVHSTPSHCHLCSSIQKHPGLLTSSPYSSGNLMFYLLLHLRSAVLYFTIIDAISWEKDQTTAQIHGSPVTIQSMLTSYHPVQLRHAHIPTIPTPTLTPSCFQYQTCVFNIVTTPAHYTLYTKATAIALQTFSELILGHCIISSQVLPHYLCQAAGSWTIKRVQFCKEAIEYDVGYMEEYDKDLNTSLIFPRLMSSTCPCNHPAHS